MHILTLMSCCNIYRSILYLFAKMPNELRSKRTYVLTLIKKLSRKAIMIVLGEPLEPNATLMKKYPSN